MSVPKTAADILRDHVTLEVEGIYRMDLNVYVPELKLELGLVGFLRYHRGHDDTLREELGRAEEQFRHDIKEGLAAKGRALETIRSRPDFEHAEADREWEHEQLVTYHTG